MKRGRASLALVLASAFACGTRVTVGFVDAPPREAGAPVEAPVEVRLFGDASPDAEAAAPTVDCASTQCGDPCIPCTEDASCPPPAVFHVCSGFGECGSQQPACFVVREDAGDLDWSPCVGRRCGDPCSRCDPSAPSCNSSSGLTCQANGTCRPERATCGQ